jgi:imipenem/basic amino acid-specific outer membrane pore
MHWINRHRNAALFASMTLAAGIAQAADSDQQSSQGFIADSHLNLLDRNYYLYRNFVNHTGVRNYYREWANGLSADFTSGFTQGTVGFGVDAQAYWGLRLDSGAGTIGSGLLPIGSDGRAESDYTKANASVKMRWSKTVLKYGYLQPANPVINTSDSRLFPQSFEGFQLVTQDINKLRLETGHFTSANSRTSQDHSESLGTGYSNVSSKSATYGGGTYTFNDQFNATVYSSNLEDVWNQHYVGFNHSNPVGKDMRLTGSFNLFRTLSEGRELSGSINNTTWSLMEGLHVGGHVFSLAYQKVHGNEDYDHEGTPGQYGNLWVANSIQIYDFNGPNEQSWQARYDYDFAAMGIPGLSYMVRYVKGFDIDGSKANSHYAGRYGDDEKHWERDMDLKYVVQAGPLRNLSTTLRYATHRGSSSKALTDVDEVRVIMQYPFKVF